ncbi:MAG TPA: hypothetical protein VN903_26895 [Polyangia bacterium]|nr:hypothetical protein [Polyangia bacterium]
MIAAGFVAACGGELYEVPVETPIPSKLDVTPFQRVLVAGFVAGGNDEIDANQETVRLLRSQLRTKSELRVIDADPIQLVDVAQEQNKAATAAPGDKDAGAAEGPSVRTASAAESSGATVLPQKIKDEKDLEPYERLFANTAYWKRIGEEYQNPLIVTGSVLFVPRTSSGLVTRETEVYDGLGRRRVIPQRVYMERKGFMLRPKFIFIDGRTGATISSLQRREEALYNSQNETPALSTYFELMDRIVPDFLGTLSTQKIKGTRVLLK